MTRYEELEQLAHSCGIRIHLGILREEDMLDGLYVAMNDGTCGVLINRHRTLAQRTAALVEELGHHFRSVGDLRSLATVQARKSELAGHAWGIETLLPPAVLRARLEDAPAPWELAEETGLPVDFVIEAADYCLRRPARPAAECSTVWSISAVRPSYPQQSAPPTDTVCPMFVVMPCTSLPAEPGDLSVPTGDHAPAMPSYSEQFAAIYRRGESLYGLKPDDRLWDVLFGLWFDRDLADRYEGLSAHVLRKYSKLKLFNMVNRIFRDYFVSIGRIA